jgi:hypothetical protein
MIKRGVARYNPLQLAHREMGMGGSHQKKGSRDIHACGPGQSNGRDFYLVWGVILVAIAML